MIEKAGEHSDCLAFHHLFDPGKPLPEAHESPVSRATGGEQ
jgi:hypothetical protein